MDALTKDCELIVEKELLDIRAMLQEMIDIVNTRYPKEDGTPFSMEPSVEIRTPLDDNSVWIGETFPSFINIFKDGTSIFVRGHHADTLPELIEGMKKTVKEDLEGIKEGKVHGFAEKNLIG